MKNLLTTMGLLAASIISHAQSMKVIEGFSSPESVLQSGSKVFVSNVGVKLEPAAKDADGFISLLSAEGQIVEKKFLPLAGDTLNAPKGMALIGNTLYVADIDQVKGFDIRSRKQVWSLSFDGTTSFLNDLAVTGNRELAVSATDAGKIFLISLSDRSYRALPLREKIPGANGLWFDAAGKSLYVNGFGENNQPNGSVFQIRLGKQPTVHKLSDRQGYYDGLFGLGNRLLVSDWIAFEKRGVVIAMDKAGGKATTLSLPEAIGGPADFWVDVKSGTLWMPAMLEGKVYALPLAKQK